MWNPARSWCITLRALTTLTLLLSGSGGYGFVCCIDNLISRNKGGKAFINLAEGETLCVPVFGGRRQRCNAPADRHPCGLCLHWRPHLTFDIGELKAMEKGGRGLMLMDLEAKDSLAGAAAYTRSISILGVGSWRQRPRRNTGNQKPEQCQGCCAPAKARRLILASSPHTFCALNNFLY